MLQAAKTMHHFPRAHQVWRIGRIARQFQGEVCLASGVQFRRSAGIDAPTAVGLLTLPDIIRQLGNALRVCLSENVEIVDVIRFECGIGLELALPVAPFRLKGEKMISAALDGPLNALSPVLLLPRDWRRCNSWFLSNTGK